MMTVWKLENLWSEGEDFTPSTIGIGASLGITQLSSDDAVDACTQHISLIIKKHTGVIVESTVRIRSLDVRTGLHGRRGVGLDDGYARSLPYGRLHDGLSGHWW